RGPARPARRGACGSDQQLCFRWAGSRPAVHHDRPGGLPARRPPGSAPRGRPLRLPARRSWAGPLPVRRLRITMTIRLALGHIEAFDDTVATFAQQLGLTSVQFHTPSDLAGERGYWGVDELVRLRERCENAGLVVEG